MTTAGEIIADVRGQVGRVSDVSLATDSRIFKLIGDFQRDIIARYPLLPDCSVTDTDSLATVADQSEYELNLTAYPVGVVITLRYMEPNGTKRKLLRYPGGAVQMDEDIPCIADRGSGEPVYYARKNNTLILYPQPEKSDVPLYLWHTIKPADPTSTSDTILLDEFYLALVSVIVGNLIGLEVAEQPEKAVLANGFISDGLAKADKIAGRYKALDVDISF